jgi:hypothetical protein
MQTMFKRQVEIFKDGECVDVVVRNVIKPRYRQKQALVRYQKLWRPAFPAYGPLPENHKNKIWRVEID